MSTTVDAESAKEKLLAEREKLIHQLAELGATPSGELRSDVDLGEGFADAAAITAERTERLGLVESLKSTLDSIDSALGHIEDGTYGICQNCGKQIDGARMEARPAARFCVDCKSKQ